MSWQAYVDEHLMREIEGNHLTSAAIICHDGAVWAQSAAFPSFMPRELDAINKDFDEPGSLASTGLLLGGEQYVVIPGEPGAVIRGKKGTFSFLIEESRQIGVQIRVDWAASSSSSGSLVLTSPGCYIHGMGTGGVTVKKTNQALIIGIYDKPMVAAQCDEIVEGLGNYLIEQGL